MLYHVMAVFGSGVSFASSRAACFIKVRACFLGKKCNARTTLRSMSYNFGEDGMGVGGGEFLR